MRFLCHVSDWIARAEIATAAVLAAAIAALILLNVVTRTAGLSLFWVDEAAISAMVWMAFLGASASIRHRSAVAVTLVSDALPAATGAALGRATDFLVLVFAASVLWLSLGWFDPLGLARAGFSITAFSDETFNFIYDEATTTLGFAKFWLWLIMPLFGLCATIHALSNLLARPAEVGRSVAPAGLD